MTLQELENKYNHLVDLTARMRAKQKHYDKYRIGEDLKRKRALENQVDGLIAEEMKRKGSQQKEIF